MGGWGEHWVPCQEALGRETCQLVLYFCWHLLSHKTLSRLAPPFPPFILSAHSSPPPAEGPPSLLMCTVQQQIRSKYPYTEPSQAVPFHGSFSRPSTRCLSLVSLSFKMIWSSFLKHFNGSLLSSRSSPIYTSYVLPDPALPTCHCSQTELLAVL